MSPSYSWVRLDNGLSSCLVRFLRICPEKLVVLGGIRGSCGQLNEGRGSIGGHHRSKGSGPACPQLLQSRKNGRYAAKLSMA